VLGVYRGFVAHPNGFGLRPTRRSFGASLRTTRCAVSAPLVEAILVATADAPEPVDRDRAHQIAHVLAKFGEQSFLEDRELEESERVLLHLLDGRGISHQIIPANGHKRHHLWVWTPEKLAGPSREVHRSDPPKHHHAQLPQGEIDRRLVALEEFGSITEAAEFLGLRTGTLQVWWSGWRNRHPEER
jgi:hypothetical protein